MPHDIERYLNIRSARSPSFSPNGRLSFLLNTTGVPQVWTLDGPREWPEQRTFHEERVSFASWSPTREEMIYGMDEGGNERMQLYRLAGDGSESVPLTDIPDAKHRFGGWSHDGNRFAFTSNRRDESVFDVYVQDRNASGEEAELVHEGDGWLNVVGFSPDDSKLAIHEAYSNFDHDVYVLDLDTGDFDHLTPHEGNVRYQSVEWGPSGDALYLATDDGTDTLYLAKMGLERGDLETIESGGNWNVSDVDVDVESGRIIYSKNVDGYTEFTVGELDGSNVREYPEPDIPHGVAGGVAFDDTADRFAVTVTASAENTNVYVVDVETGESNAWTNASTAGIPKSSFVSPELVHYESFDDLEIPAFLSVPPSDGGELPTIVDI
ncbi:MAG: S9 family peptidase, partial [Halobacteriaceae archaeon]